MNYRILTYEQIDRDEWNRLVQASATGTWFQTPEAYEFFASMPEMFKPFVVGVEAYSQPLPEGKGEEPTPNPSLKGRENFANVWGVHTADSTQYNLLKANAQANRKNPTEAESALWDMLKGNNIGLHFRRQHIILDYIVDFICLEKGLVIELDGGYHNNPEQSEYDKQRTAHLQQLGYTELRFTNEELLGEPESVIARIKEVAVSLHSFQRRGAERFSTLPCRECSGLGSSLRGICVGYVTVEKNPARQFFTRRAIIIGGPALADDASSEEAETMMKAVRQQLTNFKYSPIYIETRNFHDYSRWKEAFSKAGFGYRKHLNFHIDCTDKDGMYELLSETRRRQIRKAISSDVKTMEAQSEQEIADWYYILAELYRRKVKTPLFPLSFFIEFYRQKRGVFLLVKYEGKVIGGMMCPIFDGKCIYEWFVCGMDNEYKNQYPSVMATWAAMEYATEYNIPMFDIMGAGVPGVPYGVRAFKAEFGGEMVEHGRFLHVAKPLLYHIGAMAVAVLKGRNQT
ncbi:MAG: peptidoglycan bridge formation glycyltransferase FemA/FemB family protein [Paludibacteraceae bacterium]|nr:peptidoglycan bridge formation glycyltransferase FemA/FemB family protein [Paludibacteraceae bacterium]